MEGIVAIVAIVFGYKLLSELFAGRKEVKIQRYRNHGAPEQVVVQETPSELQARADDLRRRLATLEEIIASERRA